MPAPVPRAPAAPPSGGRLNPPRLLGAVAFAAVGFVAVWQGFGLAGFGTDVHALRVLVAAAALFACGMVFVWPRMRTSVRALVVVFGLAAAGAAWWFVASAPGGGLSLREAGAERDRLKALFAAPLLDDVPNAKTTDRAFAELKSQYPTMIDGLSTEHARWIETAEKALAEKYRQLSPDDISTAQELSRQVVAVGEFDPGVSTRLQEASREWLVRATKAKTDECRKLPHADWAAFDRTAAGRHALAGAFPMIRPALVVAENEWVDSSIEEIVNQNLTPKVGEPPTRDLWLRTQKDVLALKALDVGERRFAKARLRLFTVAHRGAQSEVTAHLAAGHDARAFGVARTHAVEWNATATLLGVEELKKLDALRETCEFFDKLASKAAKPAEPADIAPEPRPKP